MFKSKKPIFVERSFIPKLLSFFAPIEIGAVTLGFVVFSREEMDERTRRHETIHFQQYLETFFIGFLLFYFYDYAKGRAKGIEGSLSYRAIRAEREAYANDNDPDYLKNRKRYKWLFSPDYENLK